MGSIRCRYFEESYRKNTAGELELGVTVGEERKNGYINNTKDV